MQEQLPSLHAVNEDFFAKFNAARASKVVFQQAVKGAALTEQWAAFNNRHGQTPL